MKRIISAVAVTALALLASGCVTVTPPISLKPEFWQQRQGTIGVVMQGVTPMDMYAAGQQGLLDVAISRGANSALIDTLRAADTPRLKQIPVNIEKQFAARGFTVKMLDKPVEIDKLPDFTGDATTHAKKDFRGLKQAGIDRILLINVPRAGIQRGYYGFIPLGGPSTTVTIVGQMVDLSTNQLLWNQTTAGSDPIPDPWDAPPEFENVVKAVTQTKERIAAEFERGLFAPPAAR